MWCTCVTLETVKKRHKQGDPLPPTDSLCFDSASFFPSYIHHLMYGTLLGGRRAMRRTCLLWFWTGNVCSESELQRFHPPSSPWRIAHRSSRCRSETRRGRSATPQRAPIPRRCVTRQLPAPVTSEFYSWDVLSGAERLHENDSSSGFSQHVFPFCQFSGGDTVRTSEEVFSYGFIAHANIIQIKVNINKHLYVSDKTWNENMQKGELHWLFQ